MYAAFILVSCIFLFFPDVNLRAIERQCFKDNASGYQIDCGADELQIQSVFVGVTLLEEDEAGHCPLNSYICTRDVTCRVQAFCADKTFCHITKRDFDGNVSMDGRSCPHLKEPGKFSWIIIRFFCHAVNEPGKELHFRHQTSYFQISTTHLSIS